MGRNKPIILIDADVVSHFITAGAMLQITAIFDYQIKILDKVYEELKRFPGRFREVENFLKFNQDILMDFPETNSKVKMEYFRLKKTLGDGESACLAVANFGDKIIASSNLKDIKKYCEDNSIIYLTTMDFLCEALRTGKMSESECDSFISKVLQAKSKLPVTSMANYTCIQKI